jgi:transcriptional regulator
MIVAIVAIGVSIGVWFVCCGKSVTFNIIINSITFASTVMLIINIIKTYKNKLLYIISDKIYNEYNKLNYKIIYLSPELYKRLKWAINSSHKSYVVDKNLKIYEYSYTKKSEILTKIDELYD